MEHDSDRAHGAWFLLGCGIIGIALLVLIW
jgi:hypothetical protein